MQNNPLIHLSGQSFHLLIRGALRQELFHRPADYIQYLSVLKNSFAKHHCDLHAYVLMPNHVHLLLTPNRCSSLPHLVKTINRQYNMYYANRNHGKAIAWDSWFHFSLIENTPYILTLYRYLELNPVRSHITKAAASYPWSSYMCNTHGKSCCLLKPHEQYLGLAEDPLERQLCYAASFDEPLHNHDMKLIHKSILRNRIIGSDEFVRRMIKQQSWKKSHYKARQLITGLEV